MNFLVLPLAGLAVVLLFLKKILFGPPTLLVVGSFLAVETGGLLALIMAHPFAFAICFYYLISTAVTSMADPWDGCYKWFYRFSHGMVAVVRTEIDKRDHTVTTVTQQTTPHMETTKVQENKDTPSR